MDLEGLEYEHPKCFLIVIGLGMIIELYVLFSL